MIYLRGHKWEGLDGGITYFTTHHKHSKDRNTPSYAVLCIIDDSRLMKQVSDLTTSLYKGTVELVMVWLGGVRRLIFYEQYRRFLRLNFLSDEDLIRRYRYEIKELEEFEFLTWHYINPRDREELLYG